MAVIRSYAYLMRAYDGPEIAGIPAHMCGPAGQYDNAVVVVGLGCWLMAATLPNVGHLSTPREGVHPAETFF